MRQITLLLVSAALAFAADDPQSRLHRWLDAIAQKQLDARAAAIRDIRDPRAAARRQQEVREKILTLIGGLPDYEGPLNARITGRLDHPAFTIEKVVFESLPKLLVTGNLYLPKQPGRHPGVLLPLGHWEEGKPSVQRIAANLALKGFVVFAYDPLGQGERLQAYDSRLGKSLAGGATDQHFMAGAQSILAGESFARYRIWDAKRALDYLVSRPEVDSQRIGCTGCSGGGTLTTYISALDSRIKVAAPACYMNSFRVLFSGPVGDSEQSIPGFLSSGLDQADYVELFAPKPWLIASTAKDFFTPEGARLVYEEARSWYRLYNAEDRLKWVVGPGEHGTPLPVREAIYEWMIRWLKDGQGNAREQDVQLHPDFELLATGSGQVALEGSRDIYEVIREGLLARRRAISRGALLEEVRALVAPSPAPVASTGGVVRIETEPGLTIEGSVLAPNTPGRKKAVLLVETGPAPPPLASKLHEAGNVVLILHPRGLPWRPDSRTHGDWLSATRAWLVGRNLAAMRAHDILRGVDLLASRADVDPKGIHAVARDVSGIWLLLAAALDARLARIWIDRTPHSLATAFDNPLSRNLHDAVLPGAALRWDLKDLVEVIGAQRVVWSDPTDWMGAVKPLGGSFLYRPFEGGDEPFLSALLK